MFKCSARTGLACLMLPILCRGMPLLPPLTHCHSYSWLRQASLRWLHCRDLHLSELVFSTSWLPSSKLIFLCSCSPPALRGRHQSGDLACRHCSTNQFLPFLHPGAGRLLPIPLYRLGLLRSLAYHIRFHYHSFRIRSYSARPHKMVHKLCRARLQCRHFRHHLRLWHLRVPSHFLQDLHIRNGGQLEGPDEGFHHR